MKKGNVCVYYLEKDKCPQFNFKIPIFLEVRTLNPSRVIAWFLEGLHKLLGFSKESLLTDDDEKKIALF